MSELCANVRVDNGFRWLVMGFRHFFDEIVQLAHMEWFAYAFVKAGKNQQGRFRCWCKSCEYVKRGLLLEVRKKVQIKSITN